ncbi:translocation/assembly module TamB [Bacteroides caccae]|uniref:translocation/assembly module TamB domain-containing protein n=1 Tax=Bacteroides caccae TaxID=47678 RepID=UPI001C2CB3CD|nr:translocation/assembly module TamB domain-containing protein [Bacteroides caccae]MBU9956373.1 translocation/assembly module TamB [Bacteroides caccae]MBV3650259.1 translocation/assembly module TamB [Bacteroides caccae]MBV3674399.1 translocation/assembly module TamB [Bacteroides caccae]MBV3681649.1 translocation/assembly module TamB [Bacteroides caccae]MBV3699694.1 translocation/assembly module TamB [Bacteroides caccae]
MSVFVAEELSDLLNTRVTIGRINIGLLNRIIIDDVLLDDQDEQEMLKVTRLSAKFDIMPFFKGKISISSVQLFGFNINLQKKTPDSPPNFKFVLDAFASNDTVKKDNSLDLRINSILIRRGRMAYHVLSEEETPGKFNAKHIHLQNIIANISLKALSKDSINLGIKRLSLDEKVSGFSLKKMSLKLVANSRQTSIDNFAIELPETSLKLDTIHLIYDSLKAFDRFTEQVRFSFRTLPSQITLKDISPFLPALSHFKEPISLDMEVKGTVNQLTCSHLEITADNRQFRLKGDVALQDLSHPQDAYVFGTLSELTATTRGVGFLVRNLSHDYNGVPPVLERLGNVSFRGEVSGYFTDIVTYGQLHTDLGGVNMDLKLSSDKSKGLFAYSGAVKTTDYKLGKLLANEQLGEITFNLDVHGRHVTDRLPVVELKGLIASVDYSRYRYENITLDGEYKQGGFNGKVALDDPNGSIYLNGDVNVSSRIPTFNFQAIINKLRPHDLNLTSKYPDTEFSLKLRANFTGGSVDEMIGEINVDSLEFMSPEKQYFMNNMNIRASKQNNENQLRLTSEFLTASVEGKFQYHTLPASILNIMRKYVPSLILPPKKPIETHNNFQFDIHIYNTDILSTIFDIPLTVYTHSTLKGYFNDPLQRLRVEGYFPRLQYKNNFIESGMILCENPSDHIRARVRLTNLKKKGAVNLSLDAQAKDDNISTTLNWGNSAAVTYSGQLAAVAKFLRTEGEKPLLKAMVEVKPTDIILNDTLWQIHPSQVVVDSGKVDVNNFYFSHQDRYVRINGRLSDNPQDSVKVDLKDINMGYVFDIASISDDVNFEGDATGTAYASGVFKKPVMNTRLFIKNFSLNQGRLGDLNIYGEWDNENRGIRLDASIKDISTTPSRVTGIIHPLKPESGLDLNIEANELNLKFLEHYMKSIANDIKGRATGKVHFYGKFKGLNLDGVVMTDASMNFDILNTHFAIKDTILLAPTGLTFNNIHISDMEGHSGRMNGYLHFQHFKNLNYRFEIQANNMLVMNTKESTDMPFYGTVYGTGNALLTGNAIQGLDVNVAMTTNRNSIFTYINGSVASATSNQFIKFVDKTPRRTIQDSIQIISYYEQLQQKRQEAEEEQKTDIRLNILVDATPDATMKIIMDPVAGDYISGKGTGNIRTEFYNKGDVKMFGSYQINQGVYKFSLQEVIRKDFVIKNGSTITFNGAPLDANLDIQASYTVNSASLNDLIPEESSSIIQQPNVKVNCIMNLSGILVRPTIKLGIELPNERDEVQTLVRNYISTEEQMNMQILYLLGIGKFYTEDARNNQNSNVMSSVLSSTLSGQLNNALSQVFETNNWNIGTNLSTGDKGWTDMEVEGILSGQLLNNRLLINGNFGYRDNPMANTNFVGDFEAEWLINRSGDIRLKAYNETNDRYYTKTNLTTQGVGIMYKKDFNKWSDLFFWNKWKLRNKRKQEEKSKQQTDSIGNANTAKSVLKRQHEQ